METLERRLWLIEEICHTSLYYPINVLATYFKPFADRKIGDSTNFVSIYRVFFWDQLIYLLDSSYQ